MEDLQLRHALAAPVLLQPGLLQKQRKVILLLLRHPAVALADETHEPGTGAIDLRQADGQHLALLGFLFGDAPAQVHIHQFHLSLAAFAPQLREDLANEQVTFLGEVAERAAQEDADGAGIG